MDQMNLSGFQKLFAKRILQLRNQSDLSQQELATLLGYKDKQAIHRYEKLGGNPTAATLIALANAFNITLLELLDFSKLEG